MGQYLPKCLKSTTLPDTVSVVVDDKTKPRISTNENYSASPARVHTVQNFVLLWLDSNMDESNGDFQTALIELRRIVNSTDTFTDPDQCVHFLRQIKNEKVFMVISDALSQLTVPLIHDLPQLESIYIFCKDLSKDDQWITNWSKVKGIFTQIDSICNVLKQNTQQCYHDSIGISTTSQDMNRLEPSFLYTQLLKEILLGIEYENHAKGELVKFSREQFQNNPHELQMIEEFERDYDVHTPIWWYTRECLTSQMLNRALCLHDVPIIMKMGFFLRDIHRQLEELHSQIDHSNLLTVYRGQSMSNIEFEEIKNKKDGLLAFHTFLSTSLNETISLEFAQKSLSNPALIGVLFQIRIDPSISSIPFSPIRTVSAIPKEDEVLFSMYTIFRIGPVIQIEDRLWRVDLTLTSDDERHQELKQLTDHMRTGWDRLADVLIDMGDFDKAEEIYQILLEETSTNHEQKIGHIYHQLGWIKYNKEDYTEAIKFYQKTIEIQGKSPTPNPLDLATTYSNLALVYYNQRKYFNALQFQKKVLHIRRTSLPINHPTLASTYNHIGLIYDNMGYYLRTLESYQKALEIRVHTLPSDHPDLAVTYNNIGSVHNSMGRYSKALDCYEKTLQIYQKSLLPNHLYLAHIHSNIGQTYYNMGEYGQALSSYKRAVEIGQLSLPENHPLLRSWRENLHEIEKS